MKPAYHIPTMREIEALPWNGYKVASTFSGCGGSCLGYRMAGYKVIYACEFIDEAQRTYKANHPHSYLDTRDIRQVKPEDVLEKANVDRGELDLFDGSPPCSAFSTAGKREAGWGQVKAYSDKSQRVDDLFFEYVRLIDGIRPKVFVAENVSGLVKGTAKGYFKRILAALREPGYRVSCRILDAQWLGVPQSRQRTIFVGVRDDLNLDPVHPTPLPYRYSVAEALEGVAKPGPNELRSLSMATKTERLWRKTLPGNNLSAACMEETGKGSFFNMVKLSPTKPSPTITATCQQFHWDEFRYLTIPEAKRLCSFPDDFVLTGEFLQRFERCGRSVPPLMMMQVAKTIEERILKCVA
jgi:DNA (cytosine-5)-methyltransferase 1